MGSIQFCKQFRIHGRFFHKERIQFCWLIRELVIELPRLMVIEQLVKQLIKPIKRVIEHIILIRRVIEHIRRFLEREPKLLVS